MKVDLSKLISSLGICSFGCGLFAAILTFTISLDIYFSICFIVLGIVLIIISSRLYRTNELKKMDDYIRLHSVIECEKCHTLNDLDAHFCKNCGKKLNP
ncbi:MAG: hypothetical protein SO253_04115 [Bacilli bacterium]|nr:hypothetical protein [Bacilli bacterium]